MHADCMDDDTLAAYVDGSLLAAHRAMVDEHVDRCSQCRRLLAAVSAADEEDRASPIERGAEG
jgi:anti-sigma factor RsiW